MVLVVNGSCGLVLVLKDLFLQSFGGVVFLLWFDSSFPLITAARCDAPNQLSPSGYASHQFSMAFHELDHQGLLCFEEMVLGAF